MYLLHVEDTNEVYVWGYRTPLTYPRPYVGRLLDSGVTLAQATEIYGTVTAFATLPEWDKE